MKQRKTNQANMNMFQTRDRRQEKKKKGQDLR